MRRALLNPKFVTHYILTPTPLSSSTPIPNTLISPSFSYPSKFRFFSAVNGNPSTDKPNPNSESTTVSPPPPKDFKVQDVSTKGGTGHGVSPESEQMHPHTLNVMRGFMHILNNPDVYLETANDPIIRNIADRNPTIANQLNNPAVIRRTLEVLRNEVLKKPERFREMMGNFDRLLRRIDKDGQGTNLDLFEAVFGCAYPGGAAQNQTANPETTGGDMGGAETTTGSPDPSTDPLPNLWAAAGELEQMHPETLNLMRVIMHLLNNPDVLFDEVMNDPKIREFLDQNPEIGLKLNDPAFRRKMEVLRMETSRNPERVREMMRTADRVVRRRFEKNDLEANPATTGTVNATNATPDGGVDDVSNSEILTFNVRVLNGTNFVIKANPNASVKAFKSVLEHNCNVPAGEQRLVYKGRVLYDDDHETLKTYGLESDQTVHLIRGSGGLSWYERTPSQLFGPRMHFIQAMYYSNPQFKEMMEDPEFKTNG
ncbi:uncharacterized protein [Rutidosis leptorrhynchoides]|uniref:uncharacterized protein isoform X2 n=1 Tax=Rutidosis leptorrhynchoides TaxID=125765 RepID=UPI003A9A5ABC